MTRFLFVVPPFPGHVNPTVAVGDELARRGHAVAWAGHGRAVRPLLPVDAQLFPLDAEGDPAAVESIHDGRGTLSGLAALRFLWTEVLLPLAVASLPGVQAAVAGFAPDVVVADQSAFAGAIAARERGLPWVASVTTSAELDDPYASVPKVDAWIVERLVEMQVGVGVPRTRADDLRFSDELNLVFTTEALLGPLDRFDDRFAFVGPAIGARPASADFPWEWLDRGHRHVLVTLGTVNVGERFLGVVMEAAAILADRVKFVVVAPVGMADAVPDNVLVRTFVPQLALLPRLDAVVCHAGHNTVCEALAFGVPLVVAPIRDDQPIIAGQVDRAGAGVRVPFGRVRAAGLAEAVVKALDDTTFRDAAGRVRASFAAAGGASAAADRLAGLP